MKRRPAAPGRVRRLTRREFENTLVDLLAHVPNYFKSLEHLLRSFARPPFALERLSVIRDADGRIARIRYVMPRHWMTIWAANWVGPGRSRKSTQPGASSVIELSPCAGRMPVRRPSQTLALAATALRRQGPGMALPPECQPRPACGSDPAAPEAPAQVSRSSRAAHPSGDACRNAIERAIFSCGVEFRAAAQA